MSYRKLTANYIYIEPNGSYLLRTPDFSQSCPNGSYETKNLTRNLEQLQLLVQRTKR